MEVPIRYRILNGEDLTIVNGLRALVRKFLSKLFALLKKKEE
jgi:hypothetical protein